MSNKKLSVREREARIKDALSKGLYVTAEFDPKKYTR